MGPGPVLSSGEDLRVARTHSPRAHRPRNTEPVYGRHGTWMMPQSNVAVVLPQLAHSPRVSQKVVSPSSYGERQWTQSDFSRGSRSARCQGWASSSPSTLKSSQPTRMATPRKATMVTTPSPRSDVMVEHIIMQAAHTHADAVVAAERQVTEMICPALTWLHGYVDARMLQLEVEAPSVVEREQHEAFIEVTGHIATVLQQHFPERLPSVLWDGLLSIFSHLEEAGLVPLYQQLRDAKQQLGLVQDVLAESKRQAAVTRNLLEKLVERVNDQLKPLNDLTDTTPPVHKALGQLPTATQVLRSVAEDLEAAIRALTGDPDQDYPSKSPSSKTSSSQDSHSSHSVVAQSASDLFERGVPLELQSTRALARRVLELGQELATEKKNRQAFQAVCEETTRRLRVQTRLSMQPQDMPQPDHIQRANFGRDDANSPSSLCSHCNGRGILDGALHHATTGSSAMLSSAGRREYQHQRRSHDGLFDALKQEQTRNSRLEQFARLCRAALGDDLADEIESQLD
eukprot:scaffold161430_cov36-Tisochrysis_lutea.AAC.1